MHEALLENYIERAREFVATDRWPTNPPPQWTALASALVQLAAERDRLKQAAARIVSSYDAECCMRTADCHASGCTCLRCAVDAAR